MKKLSHPSHRLYGRAKGRPLSPAQQDLMDTRFPEMEIGADPLAGLEGYEKVWLEIGFGAADHLVWQAKENPNIAVLGAEPYLNGVAKAVVGAVEHDLKNMRLHHGDVREILKNLTPNSLDRIYILFPDPWPKARHNKRRIITDELVTALHGFLKPGGQLRFASDINDYVDWSLTRIFNHGGFRWPAENHSDWTVRPDDWPGTRFEAKGIREGRVCHFFEFIAEK